MTETINWENLKDKYPDIDQKICENRLVNERLTELGRLIDSTFTKERKHFTGIGNDVINNGLKVERGTTFIREASPLNENLYEFIRITIEPELQSRKSKDEFYKKMGDPCLYIRARNKDVTKEHNVRKRAFRYKIDALPYSTDFIVSNQIKDFDEWETVGRQQLSEADTVSFLEDGMKRHSKAIRRENRIRAIFATIAAATGLAITFAFNDSNTTQDKQDNKIENTQGNSQKKEYDTDIDPNFDAKTPAKDFLPDP